jgi:hypothetical protein
MKTHVLILAGKGHGLIGYIHGELHRLNPGSTRVRVFFNDRLKLSIAKNASDLQPLSAEELLLMAQS